MNRIPFDLSKLSRFPIVSLDTETTGLYWYRDKMFGVAVCGYDPKEGVIMSKYWDVRDEFRAIPKLTTALKDCTRIVNHNMKFDALMCMAGGLVLPVDKLECTSVRAALINENEPSFSLDALAEKYLGMNKDNSIYEKLAVLFGGKPTRDAQIKNLPKAPVNLVANYATIDAELAAMLWQWQEGEIESQGIQQVWDLERRLLPVLIDIEHRGVRVDIDATTKALAESHKLANKAQDELNRAAGVKLNVNSPKQVRELFGAYEDEQGNWKTEDGAPLEKTESGNPSMDAAALRLLDSRGNELAGKILALRKATKAQSFLKDHILGHELNGRVYPNYNQTRSDNDLGTGTGRFSINDPALQQIPSRDIEIASIVRACFVPEFNQDWLSMDYSQFEFRWFAHYTRDKRIEQIYLDDPSVDFHQLVSDLTGIPRKPRFAGDANSKQINLGMVFGMGEGRLAAEMGLPYTVNSRGYLEAGPEAKDVFAKYNGEIPGVRKLLEEASSIAKARGYVQTAMGRRLRFPGGKFTHKAGGLVFQGTSADCMKVKMIEMHDFSKSAGFDMLLSVHDELDFSIPKHLTSNPKFMEDMKRIYTTFDGVNCPIKCRIPIECDASFGVNWWQASK